MYYLKSRYYDPETCRFINADDTANLGADDTILSHNLYAYCENNPVAGYDPTGMFDWKKAGLIALSVFEVIGGAVLLANGCPAGTPLISAGISSLTGAYFNEKAGGSFEAGWCGGEVGGLLSGMGFEVAGACLEVGYYDAALFFGISGGFSGGFFNDVFTQLIDRKSVNINHAIKCGGISTFFTLLALPFSVIPGAIQPYVPCLSATAAVVSEVIYDGINGEVGQIINLIN